MRCERVERQLGRYIDGELRNAERDQIETHLELCASCQAEASVLREMAQSIAARTFVNVPGSLWARIEQRLDDARPAPSANRPGQHTRLRGAPWAIAAGVVLAIGLGMFGLSSVNTTAARATTVDFSVLLDALPLDAQKAFRKFLVRYEAKSTTPVAAKRIAPALNFETPAVLPGGFKLQSLFEIRIGNATGIAAAYDRDGEFLAAVFHAPMRHEQFGSHENYPCVIGEHCGHKVQVGEWKLVHLTDPTTCHCLLSRLDEDTEIPAIMKAIAPNSPAGPTAHEH